MKVLLTSLLAFSLSGAALAASFTDGNAAANERQLASNFSVLFSRLRRNSACTPGDYKVDLNCYSYQVCEDGGWVTKKCLQGMIFSNGECRFFWEASCGPESCVAGSNKVYTKDCTKYYHCGDEKNQVLTSCPSGVWWLYTYHFNPSSLQCEKVFYWKSCPPSSTIA